MKPPPSGLHHIAVVTADLARSERFYVSVLGLSVVRRWADERGPRSVWVDLGGRAFLAIERADAAAPVRADDAPGWHCVALAIAPQERATWRARLAEAGHPVERESDFTLYTRDPDGHLLALSHWPEPAT